MSANIDQTATTWELDLDWPVVTADGVQIGLVEGVHRHDIIVRTTRPIYTVLFVPVEAISDVVAETVYLSVAMDDDVRRNWTLIPETDDQVR